MLKCPCQGCETRRINCHVKCGKYDNYRIERIKVKKDLKNAADVAKRATKYSR